MKWAKGLGAFGLQPALARLFGDTIPSLSAIIPYQTHDSLVYGLSIVEVQPNRDRKPGLGQRNMRVGICVKLRMFFCVINLEKKGQNRIGSAPVG